MPMLDLRAWLRRVDELGELRRVDGATCEEDIGMATEVLTHTEDAPVAMFDNIPGYRPGHRVLVNNYGTMRRIALTLGLPLNANKQQMIDAWREKRGNLKPIPPRVVDDGPVMENVQMGDDVNALQFPT